MVDFTESFLEKIVAVHWPVGNFFARISGNITNREVRSDGTIAPTPPFPVVSVAAENNAVFLDSSVSRASSGFNSQYLVLWVPRGTYTTFDISGGSCADGPLGQVGFNSFDELVSTIGASNLDNAINNNIYNGLTPDGVSAGPVAKYQVDYSLPGSNPINWGAFPSTLLTGGFPTPLDTAMANAAGTFLLAQPVTTCVDGGGTHKHFFNGTYAINTRTSNSNWESHISFDYLFRVSNDKANVQNLLTISNIFANGSIKRASGGVSVQLYTTDNTGTKNLPKNPPIRTLADIDMYFPDVSTGAGVTDGGGNTQLNGGFNFTYWRDNKAVPLFTGAHIIASPPFPSV